MIKSFKKFLNTFNKYDKEDFSEAGKKRLWEIYKEEYQQDDDDNEGMGFENYSEYENKEDLKHDYTPGELQKLEDCDDIETLEGGSILIRKI